VVRHIATARSYALVANVPRARSVPPVLDEIMETMPTAVMKQRIRDSRLLASVMP
jgi:hypothetical protein